MDDPDGNVEHPLNRRIWPHICGICRSPEAKKCSACKSVSFCGKEHQLQAWKKHKRVCKFFQEFQKAEKDDDNLKEIDLINNLVAWRMFQDMHPEGGTLDNAKIIRQQTEREQIMNVARCLGCGTLPPLSIVCQCKAVAFCSPSCEAECKRENSAGIVKHSKILCSRFAETVKCMIILKKEGFSPGVCSEVIKKSIQLVKIASDSEAEYVKQKNLGMEFDGISKYAPFSVWNKYFDQVGFSFQGLPLNAFGPGFATAIADGLSNALTICYAIEKAGVKYTLHHGDENNSHGRRPLANEDNIFTIHVIGAESDWQGFSAYEEVVHRLMLNGKRGKDNALPEKCAGLRIIFVGPELYAVSDGLVQDCSDKFLCDHCSSKKLKFLMEFHTSFYENFVENKLLANKSSKPDVLIAYNCGIHDDSSVRAAIATEHHKKVVSESAKKDYDANLTHAWKACIETICKLPTFDKVPFILTGFDMFETNKDEEVACSFESNDHALKPILMSEENPFQSPLWQPESFYRKSKSAPVTFTDNFALTVLERRKREMI